MQENLLQKKFSHIYMEDDIRNRKRLEQILAHFPGSRVIPIHHYKDVFNRSRQDFMLQHKTQNLVLAEKKGELVYPGAPVCQSFGNEHFYYTSSVMNCIYDCEYCYLKGMYPSGNLVVFLNLEDIFQEVEKLLKKHPVYLCVSYDTDLMALEHILGYVKLWSEFTLEHPDLSIEVRTKSGDTSVYRNFAVSDRCIFAFTLSPDYVAENYEHGSGNLRARIAAAREALDAGFPVRLCFDPMIYVPGWKEKYEKMLQLVKELLPLNKIRDISVGSFRISNDYLKSMRKAMPDSAVVQFPYENHQGYYQYPKKMEDEMEQFLEERLEKVAPGKRIFRWE